MSQPSKQRSAAWVAVPGPDELPDQVEETIRPISEKVGFVPNVARLLAITPEHFVGGWSYFDDLMRGPSGLSKTQREMIAVVVSGQHAVIVGSRNITDEAEISDEHSDAPPGVVRLARRAGPGARRRRVWR